MSRMVKTNVGTMPIEDYREIKAWEVGFDSYREFRDAGYRLGGGMDEDDDELYESMSPAEIVIMRLQMDLAYLQKHPVGDCDVVRDSYGFAIQEVRKLLDGLIEEYTEEGENDERSTRNSDSDRGCSKCRSNRRTL